MKYLVLSLLLASLSATGQAAGFAKGDTVELARDADLYYQEVNLIRRARAGEHFTVIFTEPKLHRVYVSARDALDHEIALSVAEDAVIPARPPASTMVDEFTYLGNRFVHPKVVGLSADIAMVQSDNGAMAEGTAVPWQVVPQALLQRYADIRSQLADGAKPLFSFAFFYVPDRRKQDFPFTRQGVTYRFSKRTSVYGAHDLYMSSAGSPDCSLGLMNGAAPVKSDIVIEFNTKEPVGALKIAFWYAAKGSGEADCFLLMDPPALSDPAKQTVSYFEKKIPISEANEVMPVTFRWVSNPVSSVSPGPNGGVNAGVNPPTGQKAATHFRLGITAPAGVKFLKVYEISVGALP